MIDHCLVFISIKISYLLTYFELDFFLYQTVRVGDAKMCPNRIASLFYFAINHCLYNISCKVCQVGL